MERKYTEEANKFCRAIERLSARPANMDNLECYLQQHFAEWLKCYADTPEDMAAEITAFADMDI